MGGTEPWTFVGAAGARLTGVLHHPDGEPAGSVLLAHCFTCSKDLHTMTRLPRTLTGRGCAVLRFDFTGLRPGCVAVVARRSASWSFPAAADLS